MTKIMCLFFLLFLISLSALFSQDVNRPTFSSRDFGLAVSKTSSLFTNNSNKLSTLSSINFNTSLASLKTHVANDFIANSKNYTNHTPLVFAKINFFGIDNLEAKDDLKTPFKEEDTSFWDNEIIYFVIGAVAATALYLVWQNSGDDNPPQKTFGLPQKPQEVYGL